MFKKMIFLLTLCLSWKSEAMQMSPHGLSSATTIKGDERGGGEEMGFSSPRDSSPSVHLLDLILHNTRESIQYVCLNLGDQNAFQALCSSDLRPIDKLPLDVIGLIPFDQKIDILTEVLAHPISAKGIVSGNVHGQGLNLFNFFSLPFSNLQSFVLSLKQSVATEIKFNRQEFSALYTSINSGVGFLYDVYSELNRQIDYQLEHLNESKIKRDENNSIYMRVSYDKCTDEILEQIKSGNDRSPIAEKCLLSTNFSPWSNMLQTGESTFQLFLKGNAGGDFYSLLEQFILDITPTDKISPTFASLYKAYQELYENYYFPAYDESGILVQILIPQSVIDKITYISAAYGITTKDIIPVSEFLSQLANLSANQPTDSLVKDFLSQEIYSKLNLNNPFFGKKHDRAAPIDLTHAMPQIRLFMHKDYMNQVKIYMYRAGVTFPRKEQEYRQQLKRLVSQHLSYILEHSQEGHE